MLVFLLTAVPIGYLVLLFLLEGHSLPTRVTIIPAVKGALAYVVVYVVMLIFDAAFPLYYNATQIFLHFAALEYLLPLAVLTVTFFLFNFAVWKDSRIEGLIGMMGFFTGYFEINAIGEFFTQHNYFSPYYLFLLPLSWVALLALIPCGLAAFRSEHSPVRWAYVAMVVIGTVAFAVVPMLETLEHIAPAVLTSVGLFLLSIAGSYAVVRLYVPVRV